MEEICRICFEPLDEDNVATCALCGGRFHLAWSVDAEVEECGRIWFDPASCGVRFVCNRCLSENPELVPFVVDTEGGPPALG